MSTIVRIVVAVGLAALLVQPAVGQQARRARVRGYVVDVPSPTEFTLDDFGIVEDRTYRVNAADVPGLTGGVVRIGADLEVEGRFDSAGAELRATTVRRRPPPEDNTPRTITISTPVPIEPGEKSLWDWMRVEIREPDFDRRRSGRVTVRNDNGYQIIASAEVQEYIADLGARLVPSFQRDLPDGDPAKIPFKFYVVRHDQAGASAVASVIQMYSRTFEILTNEAQLAALLAHEIAHVTQKHQWRLDKMPPSSVRVGYERSYENQADRLSVEYAVSAGYDPREAAMMWKRLAMKIGFTPLRGTHDSHPARRAYIMRELEANYQETDYGALKTEEDRYKQIAERVKKPF